MDLKTLRAELQKLAALAEEWDVSHEIADIERDLALAKLRVLYDAVRFGLDSAPASAAAGQPLPEEMQPVAVDLDAVISLADAGAAFADAAELQAAAAEPPVATEAPAAESSLVAAAAAGGPVEPVAAETAGEAAPADSSADLSADLTADSTAASPVGGGSAGAVLPEEAAEPVSAASESAGAESAEAPRPAPLAAAPVPDASKQSAERAAERPAAAKEPTADAEPLSLFELDPVEVKRAKHRVVLSLYGDAEPQASVRAVSPRREEPQADGAAGRPAAAAGKMPAAAAEQRPESVGRPAESAARLSAPEAAEAPAAVPAADAEGPASAAIPAAASVSVENAVPVLGETLNTDVKTVSDAIAETVPAAVVGQEPVTDLRRSLCNNDRFLLARDLFGGDMAACERTIDRLNAFDDLTECMIYIAENFDWNPHSEGAKLLVELIERKLA